jgi:hypothetical protein
MGGQIKCRRVESLSHVSTGAFHDFDTVAVPMGKPAQVAYSTKNTEASEPAVVEAPIILIGNDNVVVFQANKSAKQLVLGDGATSLCDSVVA